MTQKEFEEKVGQRITDVEFAEIEYVLIWHPALNEAAADGRAAEQIASIYNAEGMPVVRGMAEAAGMMEEIKEEQRRLAAKQDCLRQREERLSAGYTDYERCIADLAEMKDEDILWEFESLRQKYGGEAFDFAMGYFGLE